MRSYPTVTVCAHQPGTLYFSCTYSAISLCGHAWAFTKYSSTCVAEEQQARQENLGVHAHGCRPAWEWRMLEKLGVGLEET